MEPKTQVGDLTFPRWILPFAVAFGGYLILALCSARSGRLPLGIWWSALAVGWVSCLWFLRAVRHGWPEIRWIILTALALRCCGLWVSPPLEDDYQRYLWDGWRTLRDGSPYQHTPQEFFSAPEQRPPAIEQALNQLNHPGLTTIYAPVTQLLFAVAALIAPGSVFVLKFLLLLVDLGLLLLLAALAGRGVAWLYGWCPLVVTENAFHAHVEAWALLWLIAAWLCAKRERYFWAGVLAGVAVGAKLFAVPALPFLAWRRLTIVLPSFLATLAIIYLPILATGSLAEWPGLHAMATSFEFNSLVFAFLASFCGAEAARSLWLILFALLAAILFLHWVRRGQPLDQAPMADLLLIFLILSPVLNPWYIIWLVPFAAMAPTWRALTLIAIVPLSYATGLNLGDSSLATYAQPVWVRPAEFGLLVLAFLADVWIPLRPKGILLR